MLTIDRPQTRVLTTIVRQSEVVTRSDGCGGWLTCVVGGARDGDEWTWTDWSVAQEGHRAAVLFVLGAR